GRRSLRMPTDVSKHSFVGKPALCGIGGRWRLIRIGVARHPERATAPSGLDFAASPVRIRIAAPALAVAPTTLARRRENRCAAEGPSRRWRAAEEARL